MKRIFNIAIIAIVFCSLTSAQDIISAGGMQFVEMTKEQIKKVLYGNYYVDRPKDGFFYDVDDGTLGIVVTDKGLTLRNGFAQTIYPAKGSGNITGAVTETAEYYNGRWYKCSSCNETMYAYLDFEININVMNFKNTVWAGNSTIHESKIGRTKGVFLRKYQDGEWLYISNHGRFTFNHYTATEIAEIKAKKAAEQKRQEEERLAAERKRQEAERLAKAEKERKVKEAAEREYRRKEDQRRAEEEKAKQNRIIFVNYLKTPLGLSFIRWDDSKSQQKKVLRDEYPEVTVTNNYTLSGKTHNLPSYYNYPLVSFAIDLNSNHGSEIAVEYKFYCPRNENEKDVANKLKKELKSLGLIPTSNQSTTVFQGITFNDMHVEYAKHSVMMIFSIKREKQRKK